MNPKFLFEEPLDTKDQPALKAFALAAAPEGGAGAAPSVFSEEMTLAILPARKGTIDLGIVRIEYALDLMKLEISIVVYALGIKLGALTLSRAQVSGGIHVKAFIFKVDLEITADFTKDQLLYDLKACVMNWKGSWSCTSGKGVIFSW